MSLKNCPICTTRLKKQDGRLVCPDCGYHVADSEEPLVQKTQPQSSIQAAPAQAQPQVHAPISSARPPQPQVYVSTVKAKKQSVAGLIAVSAFALAFFALLLVAIRTLNNLDTEKVSDSVANIFSEEDDFSAYEDIYTYDDSDSNATLPQSDFFRALVSQIFEKEADAVTEEDVAKVNQLHFYYDADDRKCIYAFLDDGSVYSYFANDDLSADYGDLSCFPNLVHLTLEYGYPSGYDLDGLVNLTSIASDMTLTELAEVLPCPEKLTSIEIYSTIFMDSMEGIDAFPNLTSLSADCMSLEDISQLADAPQLEQLSLTDCDWLEDYSPLYKLPNLVTLVIESSALKDIGFVREMPQLSYLSISDAEQLKSIDALSDRADTMHYLYLEDTWGIEDYQVLESLTNLEELQFHSPSYRDTKLPSFASMKNLTSLNLYGAGDLSGLAEAKNLLYLTLESCNCEDLSFLAEMDSLVSLELTYMSGYFVGLEPIQELPNLQRLSISDSSAYANVEALLGIPTLTEFYLNGCNIGFRPDLVPCNENLMVLDMSDVTLHPLDNPNDYGWLEDHEELCLSDHTEIFANFPHLCELYLAQNDLDDLTFLEENPLTDLQILDITDNYVTDLSPLSGYEYLYKIKCAGNPIADTAGLDDLLLR